MIVMNNFNVKNNNTSNAKKTTFDDCYAFFSLTHLVLLSHIVHVSSMSWSQQAGKLSTTVMMEPEDPLDINLMWKWLCDI